MKPFELAFLTRDTKLYEQIREQLDPAEYRLKRFLDLEDFLRQRERGLSVRAVLYDDSLSGLSAPEAVRTIRAAAPHVHVIPMVDRASVEEAVCVAQEGGFHYLSKPVSASALRALLERLRERIRLEEEKDELLQRLSWRRPVTRLVGADPSMKRVLETVEKVSPLDCPVLIQGEEGAGKETVARLIHAGSPRRNKPFIPFRCSDFAVEWLADELLGHEKAAFPGAEDTRIGLLESAPGAIIYLDGIERIPPSVQARLLGVMEEGHVVRLGGTRPVPADVRILAATGKNLGLEARMGRFRQDFYYRLSGVSIRIPPLRQRKKDIPLLLRHFLERTNALLGKKVSRIAPEAMEALQDYAYPGNVRELEAVVEQAVAAARGSVLELEDLPLDVQKGRLSVFECGRWLPLAEKERQYIESVLAGTGYNKSRAARILKIPRTTLWRKLKLYGIQ